MNAMAKKEQVKEIEIIWMDGRKEYLILSSQMPSHFVDNGVLNVNGRVKSGAVYTPERWYYYPIANIRMYSIVVRWVEGWEVMK